MENILLLLLVKLGLCLYYKPKPSTTLFVAFTVLRWPYNLSYTYKNIVTFSFCIKLKSWL